MANHFVMNGILSPCRESGSKWIQVQKRFIIKNTHWQKNPKYVAKSWSENRQGPGNQNVKGKSRDENQETKTGSKPEYQ